MNRTLIALSLLLSVAACKKPVPVEEPVAVTTAPSVAVTAPDVPATLPEAIAELKDHFSRVQFDYDSATLNAESKSALEANARILAAHPQIRIEVQGHADARGTTEYNLGLGNRRATSIRDYLIRTGVSGSRVTTASYGEERPLDAASTEVAWSTNRRGEFRILAGSGHPQITGTVD